MNRKVPVRFGGGEKTEITSKSYLFLSINENADPDVVDDILKEVNKIVLFEDGYKHYEGNSAAHIKASMFGFSLQIMIEENQLVLGRWQGIYFCEFDGPRSREVYVKIV